MRLVRRQASLLRCNNSCRCSKDEARRRQQASLHRPLQYDLGLPNQETCHGYETDDCDHGDGRVATQRQHENLVFDVLIHVVSSCRNRQFALELRVSVQSQFKAGGSDAMFDTIILLTGPVERLSLMIVLSEHNPCLTIVPVETLADLNALMQTLSLD